MIRIPYRNVVLDINALDNLLSISAPWIHLDLEILEEDKSWVTEAFHNWKDNYQSHSIQKCLELLKEFPLWYAAPQTESFNSSEVEDFIIPIDLENPQKCCFSFGIPKKISKDLPENWEWNLEEIQQTTQINSHGVYDPKSLTTYLMGKCLAMDVNNSSYDLHNALDTLRDTHESAFFQIIGLVLRQTHYITHCFSKTVSPALKSFPQAFDVIEEFIQEEKGHEFLMEKSLNALGIQDPTEIPVLWETSCMMKIFQKSATLSPLAFSNLVSFFEGISYGESDPLGDILRKSSKPKAAKGYDMHFKINKESNHAGEIMKLMDRLPLQSQASSAYTVRILELMMHLRRAAEKSIIKKISCFLDTSN
jgi:hypothetical protein